MAIFDPKDTETKVDPAPKVLGDSYRHSLTDSEFKNQYSFYHLVNGTPVVGTYYRGYLGAGEEPIGFQPNNYAVYQSYTRVDRMVIKIDGDPGFMYDGAMGEVTETFQAYVFFDLTPIIGDLFLKDMGDGRTGMWQVNTKPEIRTYSAIKVYQCEFKLIGMVDKATEDNLNAKTVENFIYSADSLLHGGNAVITTQQHEQGLKLTETVYFLSQYMLEHFYWEPEQTIGFKDDEYGWVYDPALATFLRDVIPSKLYAGRPPITLPSYRTGTDYSVERRLTAWDMIRQNSFRLGKVVNRKFNIYPRVNFFSTRNYLGFESTRFDHIIIPGDVINYSVLSNPGGYNPTGFGYRPQVPRPKAYEYYFTEGFYDGHSTDSFEAYLIEFFVNKNIDRERLLKFYEEFATWPKIDQLYRGGLLITMMVIARKINTGW